MTETEKSVRFEAANGTILSYVTCDYIQFKDRKVLLFPVQSSISSFSIMSERKQMGVFPHGDCNFSYFAAIFSVATCAFPASFREEHHSLPSSTEIESK